LLVAELGRFIADYVEGTTDQSIVQTYVISLGCLFTIGFDMFRYMDQEASLGQSLEWYEFVWFFGLLAMGAGLLVAATIFQNYS